MWSPLTARIKGGQRCEDPRASPDCFSCAAVSGPVQGERVFLSWCWSNGRDEPPAHGATGGRATAHGDAADDERTGRRGRHAPALRAVQPSQLLRPLQSFLGYGIQSWLPSNSSARFYFRMYSSIVCIQDEVAVWFLVLLPTDLGIFNFGLQMVLGLSFVQSLSQISVWLRSVMLCFVKSPYIIDFIDVLILLNLPFM